MLRFVQQRTAPIPACSLGKTGVTLPILGFGSAAAILAYQWGNHPGPVTSRRV